MDKLILVVEDESAIRELMLAIIMDDGYCRAVGAGNGLHALDLLQSAAFDLITLDMNMPVMDGNTFLTELSKVAPSVPVIVVSATPKILKPHKQVKAYITKPFDIEQ